MPRINFSTDNAFTRRIFDGTRAAAGAVPDEQAVRTRLRALYGSGANLTQTFGCCGFAAAIMWTLDRDQHNPAQASNTFHQLCEYAFNNVKARFPTADYDFSMKVPKPAAPGGDPNFAIIGANAEIDMKRRLAWRLRNPSWTDRPAILDLATCATLMILFKIHLTHIRQFRINGQQWAGNRAAIAAPPAAAISGDEAILQRAYAYTDMFGTHLRAQPDNRDEEFPLTHDFHLRKGDLALPYFGLFALIEFITARLGFAEAPRMVPAFIVRAGSNLRLSALGLERNWLPRSDDVRSLTAGGELYPPAGMTHVEATRFFCEIWERAQIMRFPGARFGTILGLAMGANTPDRVVRRDGFLDIAHWVYVPWDWGGGGERSERSAKVWTQGEESVLSTYLRRSGYIPVWALFVGIDPPPADLAPAPIVPPIPNAA